ncbi:phosphoenolpyruvate carboxylase [Flocculibacter collagenilyticus]|uniref:phosphoenolpyruvate carboxylase n=1 Tax=Flocculibacter collagenilyticus TaxID=2744479 RepID=UPI0018F6BADE|nr:phosphoenolpyruvate carboxylase [Flocculibacter collagenilyticus]
MNHNLHKAGVKLLNALSNHADLIMEAYFSGSVNEANYSAKVINSLIDNKVLWRPDADVQLRLRPSLRTLLEESLQDEHNRQIDANIGSTLASLKTQAEHYKEALTNGRFHESEAHLSDLTELVYGLTETLTTNVRLLWGRINNEFGYVASVDAKIRENELAQSQVSELLSQLEMFQFDLLSQIAGSHRELRHLLVVTLQASFARCTQELSLVQSRLLELLGRFREFKGRTRLLKGFMLHMEQKPDFTPTNYAGLTQVPILFNQAKSIIKPAAIDVHNVEHEASLLDIVGKIKAINHLKTDVLEARAINTLKVEEQESISFNEDKMKQHVEAYFCQIIEEGKPLSALEYHHSNALTFDQEVWLYQVIGGYQGLPDTEREYFDIDTLGEYHATYTGNFIIKDVELGLR